MPHARPVPLPPLKQLPGSCCAPPNWRRLNCGSGCCCLFVVAAATGGCGGSEQESARERVVGGAQQIPPKTMQHASWQAVRQTSANFACKQEQDFYFLCFSLFHFGFFFVHSHRVANVQKIKCKKFKWIFVLQPLFCYFLCYFLCLSVCVCLLKWQQNPAPYWQQLDKQARIGQGAGEREWGANQRR